MKPIVTITIGISGSGKSTWAKRVCSVNKSTIRINRDDLRASLSGMELSDYFQKVDKTPLESLITSLSWKIANDAINRGNNVILDNTHLNIKYFKDVLNNITEDCDFQVQWFFVDINDCIERDSKRETVIGEEVIRKQYDRFLALSQKQDEINKLIEDRKKLNFTPVVQNNNLPEAICIDIDGTLAKMTSGRSPFDWDRVDEDSVNESVWQFIDALYHSNECLEGADYLKTKVIICTGRDGRAEIKTKEWLDNHNIVYDDFYIRKSGDIRKDSIVKREFLEDIITKYNVLFAVDDRDQVVKMWRQSGIPCFQVDYGDF